jgi:hypothetical protein
MLIRGHCRSCRCLDAGNNKSDSIDGVCSRAGNTTDKRAEIKAGNAILIFIIFLLCFRIVRASYGWNTHKITCTILVVIRPDLKS